jgi:hypothetical protein
MSPLVLAPLVLLQLEALEHFQPVPELVLLLQEQRVLLRRIRLRHNQCCCRKSCSRFQRQCYRRSCKSHSLVLVHCRCCMSHNLVLVRYRRRKSHSLVLVCYRRRKSHSSALACNTALVCSTALACNGGGGGASCSERADHSDALPRCWQATLLPTQTRIPIVAFLCPS